MKKIKLWPIFLVVFLNMLGFGIIIPVIRDLTTLLVTNSKLNPEFLTIYAGILMASYSLFQFIFAPILGRISDIKGRKFVLVLSISGSIISYIMWMLSNTYFFFLTSRILAGVTGASLSVAQSYIADLTTEKDRAKHMGMMGAIFGIGFIIGPFLGGVLSQVNLSRYLNSDMIIFNQFSAVGGFTAVLSIVNLVWIIFGLDESLSAETREANRNGLLSIRILKGRLKLSHIGDPIVVRLILVYFVMQLGFNHIEAILAWDLKDRFALDTKNTGYFFAYMGIVLALIQGGIYRVLLKKMSLVRLTQIGGLLLIIGFLFMPVSYTILLLSGTIFILAFGMGISSPSIMTLTSLKTNKGDQGYVMGILQSFGSLSRIIAPIVSTIVYDVINHASPYLISAVLISIGLYIIRNVPKN